MKVNMTVRGHHIYEDFGEHVQDVLLRYDEREAAIADIGRSHFRQDFDYRTFCQVEHALNFSEQLLSCGGRDHLSRESFLRFASIDEKWLTFMMKIVDCVVYDCHK